MHFLRKRYASQPVTGAMTRITQGLFGSGGVACAMAQCPKDDQISGIYNYYEGVIFLPGAPSFVFEPTLELPIKSIWGGGGTAQGFLIAGDGDSAFKVLQPPQVYSQQTLKTSGIGGLQAGQIAMQPLLDRLPGGGE